ncbi:uncharacterized protein BKCO1_600041 [Diplodia corticola]|uniref:Tachykinin family protein n=1 Tax=Diplodia corticola TaxID=236234 RepID=A0A1J9SDE6_9PEZI|nr:uncharacterized protein BKCO1_600041 [Diplodia corticola]OJD37597.1 hypothetical protein BKCO1_600041 [Diplodia corticola]
MAIQFATPAMPQTNFSWSSPDPFAMRTAPAAPQAPPAASSSRRRTGSRLSSQSPTNDDTSNGFKFVTATRPEEFKDPELMRTVRSHVMFGVVEGRQRVTPRAKKSTAAPLGASTRGESSSSSTGLGQKRTPTLTRFDSAADSNPENPQIMAREEALDIFQRYRVPRSTASLPGSTPRSDQGTDADSPESQRSSMVKRPKRGFVATPPAAPLVEQQHPEQMLVQPPQGGRVWLNPLFDSAFQMIGPFAAFAPPAPSNPFSPHDPFLALPQPSSNIDMPAVKYYCHLYFGTRGMARAWLPQMIQSRESFLSTLAIATSHQDAMAGKPAPTTLTTMVQTEVAHLLHEAFNERWYRIKDTTIMTVVQLLCSELVNSGPARLVAHERGLRQLVLERGGLDRLGLQGELAGVATAMVYSSAIFREGQPDPLFAEYAASVRSASVYRDPDGDVRQTTTPAVVVVPESPLFCPRTRFATLERSRRCDARTLELVGKMKELVDLAEASALEQGNSNGSGSGSGGDSWATEAWSKERGILDYLRTLPPAESLPLPPTTDVERQARWRYEACRLAALLHAESLVDRRPLSSLPAEAVSKSTTTPASERSTGEPPEAAVSLERLIEAVRRSDCGFAECWGDMTGLLYWITLVGGAAARGGGGGGGGGGNDDDDYDDDDDAAMRRQRRWLTALNVRCAIVLAFEHQSAVVVSLRRMQKSMVTRG